MPVPPLQQIVCIKIGSFLLNEVFHKNCPKHPEILPCQFKDWNRLRDDIARVLDNVHLPKLLKSYVWDAVVRIYHRAWEWVDCFNHCVVVSDGPSLKHMFKELFITNWGQIDRRKMFQIYFERLFEEHGRDDRGSIYVFLNLCELCLEDSVRSVWRRMSQGQREKITAQNTRGSFLSYWLYYLEPSDHNENICKLATWYHSQLTIDENYFFHALKQHNQMASEYLWFKLSDEEQKRKSQDC